MFFNKEGYPYNFEWNEIEEYYEGKIFFDENSSDTFKTIGMYIFEEVKPIEFIQEVTLNKIEIYNESGMTFIPATLTGSTITNIEKVNSDAEFNSKWIFGEDFDRTYPKGTVVSFDNVSFNEVVPDFQNKYYTILENKPGAILVSTSTSNSAWTYVYITGGTLDSHNIIGLNDYNDTLIPEIEGYTLHTNKKLSVVDSTFNTGIKTYVDSGITQVYNQSYDMTGDTGDLMRVNIELFTERPKIYQGEVSFDISGSTATLYFTRGFNSFFNIEEGQSFIFEDYNDNSILDPNPIFTVVDGAGEFDIFDGELDFVREINITKSLLRHFNNKSLSSVEFSNTFTKSYLEENITTVSSQYTSNWWEYDNYIDISGDIDSSLSPGDTIQISATTINSPVKNDNRKYTIVEFLSFKNVRIIYWKNKIRNDSGFMNAIKAKALTNENTLDEQVELDAIEMYDTNDNDPNSTNYITITERTSRFKIKEYVIEEDTTNEYNVKKIIPLDQSKSLVCDVSTPSNTAFTMNVIAYDTTNILTFDQTILSSTGSTEVDYSVTVDAFNLKYSGILDNYGIYLFYDNELHIQSKWGLDINEIQFIPTIYIGSEYVSGSTLYEVNRLNIEVNEQLIKEEYLLNQTDTFVNNYRGEILFDLQDNNTKLGFNLLLSDNEYYIGFTGDTQTTIESFISAYTSAFDSIGVDIFLSGTNTLILDGQYPNINPYSLSAKVNSFSSYEILKEESGDGIFITGNELELPSGLSFDFYDYGLSTGMILTVSGSTHQQNNRQYNIIGLTPTIIELSYQGTFIGDTETLSFNTERFLRKPRESYDKDVYYSFRWDIPDEDEINTTKDIFFYDFTGEHLSPFEDDARLTYTGPMPLWDVTDSIQNEQIYLRDEANENLDWVNDPTKQQTVFRGQDGEYMLEFLLDQFDAVDEYDYTPEPLQTFIGFNSTDEGVSKATVLIDKVENIIFSGYTNSDDYPTHINYEFTIDGELKISTRDINFNFNNYGFEKNQDIDINFEDLKPTGTTIFGDYGPFRIKSVSARQIVIDTERLGYTITPFSSSGNTYSYTYMIKTLPRTLAKIELYGETEIEDERYSVALNNLGIQIGYDEEHVFIESDIKEQGYDYILLNAKRKEMLGMYPEIYNYVGSYKAVINSINFFGWNDLELNEYYKNINPASPLYQKLQRVLIPDIFDNTVKGWTQNDYVEGKYQTGYWKKTNLFNLSYKITDEEGNNILLYSLDEIQIKLNKLKRWLKRNMIPLSANIVDITGMAETVATNYQKYDVSNQSIKPYSVNETTVVNFNYTETLNFDTNYLFQINFYTLNGSNPSGWTAKIQTFSKSNDGSKLIPQKYYKIMRNDLNPYSFNIDKNIDEYVYIETVYFSENGVSQIYNKMINSSTLKNYLLINNNFNIPVDYPDRYINQGENFNNFYYFDENGYIYLDD